MATEDWFGIVTIRIQRPSTRNWFTAWPQGREGARERLEGFCQVLEEALSIARKDLDRLIRLGHRRVEQRGLVGPDLTLRIARPGVPCRGYHTLVAVDAPVLDLDPVRERAARRLARSDALALAGPR